MSIMPLSHTETSGSFLEHIQTLEQLKAEL